ncbi:TPA: hypothetical protein EYP66_20775 [Candidatus Poribacteria bacterium]|nr:hypothetical protein [Candidatus Poribacteria bacterium]
MSRITSTTITIMLMILITTTIPTVSADTSESKSEKPDSTAEENPLREKCYKCHDKEVEYKEWETSGHANALVTLKKSPDAESSCLTCHSSGYVVRAPVWGSRRFPRATLETAQNSVACSSCHRHGAKYEHKLIRAPKKLCISCHRMDCG